MLSVFDSIPTGLWDVPAPELYQVLPGPSLFHIKGRKEPPIFISVLLHGNEHTGWDAMREYLSIHHKALPRSLSLFIGNIEAAKHNRRYLEHQEDFNRTWGVGESDEHKIMERVFDEMAARSVFFSIDIHNNTGKNPHYACINSTHPEFIQLATMFSRTVVYFIRPSTVQSMRFSKICPAVTVECGLSGEASGIQHTIDFVRKCFLLESISDHAINNHEFDLYHTVAIVKIHKDIILSTSDEEADLILNTEIERYNFQTIPAGTVIGTVRREQAPIMIVTDEQGNDVSAQYFTTDNGKLTCRTDFVPAMITMDIDAIRKDCFCYIMERYPL